MAMLTLLGTAKIWLTGESELPPYHSSGNDTGVLVAMRTLPVLAPVD